MSVINQITAPPNGANVFNQMVFEFAYSESAADFVDVEGVAAIDVAISYTDILEEGDSIRITNGDYLGVYTIIGLDIIGFGAALRVTLNTPYIGNSTVTGSNRFTPEGLAEFQILSGYSSGPEAAVKPWQVTDELRVSPNMSGVYRFDVSGYLQSQYTVTEPLAGPNVPISLRYLVRLKLPTAIPDDTGALTAYYGLQNLTSGQQSGAEAVGERPILFFGTAPVLYSLALDKGIIHNFVATPDAGPVPASGGTVNVQLLSCEPKSINWIGTTPTAGFVSDPALPSWVQATANGNGIDLIINPCDAGAGDYLATDYDPLDYLVSGQVNSVTGCFSFDFSVGVTELFTLSVCVTPIGEIVRVCPDALNFAWLNQLGGFSSMSLDCRFTNGREFGGDSLTVGADNVLKRVEFTDVFDTVEVRGGVLSKNELDLLTSMRSAIQVYLYNQETQAWDIPIVLDRQSFQTYGNKFNQSETRFSFRFRKARRVEVQTQ